MPGSVILAQVCPNLRLHFLHVSHLGGGGDLSMETAEIGEDSRGWKQQTGLGHTGQQTGLAGI